VLGSLHQCSSSIIDDLKRCCLRRAACLRAGPSARWPPELLCGPLGALALSGAITSESLEQAGEPSSSSSSSRRARAATPLVSEIACIVFVLILHASSCLPSIHHHKASPETSTLGSWLAVAPQAGSWGFDLAPCTSVRVARPSAHASIVARAVSEQAQASKPVVKVILQGRKLQVRPIMLRALRPRMHAACNCCPS
jgi:hypothetical protein